MSTKIILIAIIVLVAAGVGFFLLLGSPEQEVLSDQEILEMMGIVEMEEVEGVDLYFSELKETKLPELELDQEMGLEYPDFNFGQLGSIEIEETSVSEISIDPSAFDADFLISFEADDFSGSGPGNQQQWTPTQANCAAFASAPNCSYVPTEHRSKCEACRTAGY